MAARLSLFLALALYWAVKLRFGSAVLDYVPFSAWLPFIPAWPALPLRIATPLSIAALGLWLARHYSYRHGQPAVILFLLIYGAVDCMATMAVYGEQLFAR